MERRIALRTNDTLPIGNARVLIGPDPATVDLVISGNTTVSRNHTQIFVQNVVYCIVDMNSKNHTYVDGCAIPSGVATPMVNGAKIRMGNEEFEFYC